MVFAPLDIDGVVLDAVSQVAFRVLLHFWCSQNTAYQSAYLRILVRFHRSESKKMLEKCFKAKYSQEDAQNFYCFYPNYSPPDHNLGQILNSDPARSYFPPEFSEILLKSIIVIQHSTDPVNRERGI